MFAADHGFAGGVSAAHARLESPTGASEPCGHRAVGGGVSQTPGQGRFPLPGRRTAVRMARQAADTTIDGMVPRGAFEANPEK